MIRAAAMRRCWLAGGIPTPARAISRAPPGTVLSGHRTKEEPMPFDSIFRPGLFAGETHVVTGGRRGIGRCTADELTHLGATVVLVGRRADPLQTVRAET